MSTIAVNYAALADGRDGLIATWNRIEGHLAELDARVAATSDMEAQTLAGYRALKARWDAAARTGSRRCRPWPTMSGGPVSSTAAWTPRWRPSSADPAGPRPAHRSGVVGWDRAVAGMRPVAGSGA
jgi:hypothetical protein